MAWSGWISGGGRNEPGEPRRSFHGGAIRRRCAAIAVVAAMSALLPPSASGAAQGLPGEPKDVRKELAKLKKQAASLSKEYRGQLLALDDAKAAAQRAADQADGLMQEWTTARSDVGRIAATSYMNGGLDVMPLLVADDPGGTIRDAAVLEHLSRNNSRRMQSLQMLAEQAAQSRQAARTKLTEVRNQIKELEGQRDRVRRLLAKYKPEKAPAPGKPDGARGTKSPIVGNNMTARMRTVLLAVDGEFGPFPTVGCYRSGDPQDHGSGKACDFMESTNGKMPSAGARAHGDQVAQYAIGNAERLGIKYVIWKQRIWDIRSGGGWKAMEDRGSVTQNHYDHVHISVL